MAKIFHILRQPLHSIKTSGICRFRQSRLRQIALQTMPKTHTHRYTHKHTQTGATQWRSYTGYNKSIIMFNVTSSLEHMNKWADGRVSETRTSKCTHCLHGDNASYIVYICKCYGCAYNARICTNKEHMEI